MASGVACSSESTRRTNWGAVTFTFCTLARSPIARKYRAHPMRGASAASCAMLMG